jgi:catechol 2,3-dioxygenase-like lactoylglutathione lyase family enzyme
MATKSILGTSDLVAFVATSDPARAKAFYGDTLGLKLVSEDQFAVVFDANGTILRIAIVQTVAAAPYTVLGWRVQDVASVAKELNNAGVTFERFGFLEQDELGIWVAPGGTKVAWFKDPDGNMLSISSASH